MTEVGETRKIGVAIGIPEPFGGELQGWRERLGDPNARRIVPHVTLLPPTTVGTGALAEIEEHLRRVAARFKPFDLRLRGSATFLPVSSVVFVPLVQGIAECEQIEAQARAVSGVLRLNGPPPSSAARLATPPRALPKAPEAEAPAAAAPAAAPPVPPAQSDQGTTPEQRYAALARLDALPMAEKLALFS